MRTLEDIEQFLTEPTGAQLKLQGNKDDVYRWIEHTLVRFRYPWLAKMQKGVLLRYIRQLSGYTRQHVTKLVKQQRKTGYIRRKQRAANGFATKYTRADICLLADVDRVVDDLSGTSIKTFCQRALEIYGDQRFSRLASISVSHIYNLRKSKVYQRCRRKFTKTQGGEDQHRRALQATAKWCPRTPACGFCSSRRYGWQERRVSHQFRR